MALGRNSTGKSFSPDFTFTRATFFCISSSRLADSSSALSFFESSRVCAVKFRSSNIPKTSPWASIKLNCLIREFSRQSIEELGRRPLQQIGNDLATREFAAAIRVDFNERHVPRAVIHPDALRRFW